MNLATAGDGVRTADHASDGAHIGFGIEAQDRHRLARFFGNGPRQDRAGETDAGQRPRARVIAGFEAQPRAVVILCYTQGGNS